MSGSRRLVLSSLLDSPALSAGILGAGVAHVALCAAGLGGWPCPFYRTTGWPCPGCGLGRACALLLHGRWEESLRLHAYAPVLLFTLSLLAVGLVLPKRARTALRAAVGRVEEKTMVSVILLVGLVVYWLLRFVLDASQRQLLVS